MTTVFLSLGSNIDRQHNIGSGLDDLAAAFGELRLSPVYESEAVGFKGSPFFNLVVALDTDLPAALTRMLADQPALPVLLGENRQQGHLLLPVARAHFVQHP